MVVTLLGNGTKLMEVFGVHTIRRQCQRTLTHLLKLLFHYGDDPIYLTTDCGLLILQWWGGFALGLRQNIGIVAVGRWGGCKGGAACGRGAKL